MRSEGTARHARGPPTSSLGHSLSCLHPASWGPAPAQLCPLRPCLGPLPPSGLGRWCGRPTCPCSTATLRPGGALCCLSLSTLVAALPRAGSGASHLLLVQGPRTSPHRDCSPLGSPSAAVLGWWAQGKGRFIFLLPWGSAFLFCYGLYKFRSWL